MKPFATIIRLKTRVRLTLYYRCGAIARCPLLTSTRPYHWRKQK